MDSIMGFEEVGSHATLGRLERDLLLDESDIVAELFRLRKEGVITWTGRAQSLGSNYPIKVLKTPQQRE